jgi:FAD/FMN-containing dehydrogenase
MAGPAKNKLRMKQYSKREFLKIMGLGLVFLPFIGCFDQEEGPGKIKAKPSGEIGEEGQELAVTEADLLLLSRNDAAYARFNAGFNKRIHHLPKYIAVCKTEKGIQHAVAQARSEHLKIAVKSGGHSFEGFSSNDGGMVINLSLLKKITWLEDDKVVVAPGCLLQEIQDAFFAKGRLLPAGSCGSVGIAGLTLGGGYGFFSREYGLTCDSLLDVVVIDGKGDRHSSEREPDLLWACRGGGNGNFGVVTSFTFRHYEMPVSFSSYVLKFRNLDSQKFAVLLDTWFEVSGTLPFHSFSAFVLNGKTLTVLITSFKEEADFESRFSSLRGLADYYAPSRNRDLPQSMKRYYGRKGPLYFKNASAGLFTGKNEFRDIKTDLFEKVRSRNGIVFQINTLGGHIGDKHLEAGSSYPHRRFPYLGELQSYWEHSAEEEKSVAVFEDIQQLLKGAGIRAHYRNYPDVDFEDWENAYYGSSYSRLQAIKRKYDPEDLFHHPQSVRI